MMFVCFAYFFQSYINCSTAPRWLHCFEKPVWKVVVDLSLRLTPLTAESEEVVGGPISLQFTQQHLIGSHTMSPAELRVVLLILGFLVTDSTLGDPCVNHTVLDQPWRSTDCSNTECTGGQWMDDGNLELGWYRFNSSGGWKIPETVVPQYRCSGEKPGWLNGPHPNVGEGEVSRTVCFASSGSTCHWRLWINMKNCSGYFVYRLWPTAWSNAVFCTEPLSDTTQERQGSVTGEPGPGLTTSPAGSVSSVTDSALGDPCGTRTILDQPWRSTDCSHTECTHGQWMSDGHLEVGWYRFNR
ncbi:oncoprotein-induced transcript 3 protein-like [Hypanus sabinus]|uniref:oncoprotein-induced transcript 3 protein-like n=1 Tax=Hypanus sabinus TaxID=79690 RepID=UPI0028C4DFE7|nr:oncoprotein-induced transcript 3 protein-like [Hypanus sabinus]